MFVNARSSLLRRMYLGPMLKHYRLLIGFLLIALVGIICLQAYFAYNDFQVKAYEFEQEVDKAFKAAIEAEKEAREDSFLQYSRRLFSDRSLVEFSAKYNEEDDRTIYSIRDVNEAEPYTSISFGDDERKLNVLDSADYELTIERFVQSVSGFYKKGSIYYWTEETGKIMNRYVDSVHCDEKQLAIFFQSQLREKRIRSTFEIQRLETDSLEEKLVHKNTVETQAYSTQFRGDPILYSARMNNPFAEILGRIKTTLMGSIFLILITAFAFFIMMRVILRQKKLSEIKDDFIDNITHELQTPIATLMAANEGMEKYGALEDPEKSKKYLAVSRMELQRLSKMVDNILMSSIQHREGFSFKWEWVNIHALIKARVDKFQLTLQEEFELELDLNAEDAHVYSDRFHLQNILDNLFENAWKYNESEQKVLQIRTRLKTADVEIIVTDNGSGIPPQYREKVFEKFYRIPSHSNHNKGFGIGLYYVKTILTQLKGQIHIDTGLDSGSSFHINLPINPHEV